MKIQNNIIRIGTMLCVSLILIVCTHVYDNLAPNAATLQKDLSSSLADYKDFLSVKSYTTKHRTEEDSFYTATIDVTAKASSGCAEYQFTADVNYVKCKQGWSLDNCKLTEKGYKIVKYPTEITVYSDLQKGTQQILTVKPSSEETGILVHSEPCKVVHEGYTEFGVALSHYRYDSTRDTWENCDINGPIMHLTTFQLNKPSD